MVHELRQIAFGDARFRCFAGKIRLHEDGKGFYTFLVTETFESFCEIDRVERVDHIKLSDGLPGLIRLQVPDEVPFDTLPADRLDLWLGLLDLIFAKAREPRFDSLKQNWNRLCLADGDELYIGSIAAGARGRLLGSRPHFGEIRRKIRH